MNQKSFSFKDDDDFEFDFDSPRRKPIIRKGRRSGSSSSGLSNAAFEVIDNTRSPGPISPKSSAAMPTLQSRAKKNGGWAEGSTSSSSSSTKMNWLRKMSRSSPLKDSPKKEEKADSDNEMPVIPDLEDVYQEDFSTQIANAPNVNVHRVMTYQELDNDLSRNAVFQTLDGIDLRLLTKHLGSENKVKEEDSIWTWDMLFTDVSSHLLEHEKKGDAKSSITDELKKMSINANEC